MGTGRVYSPTRRSRVLLIASISVLSILYLLRPSFGSSSSFALPSSPSHPQWPFHKDARPKPRPKVQFPFKEQGRMAEDKEKADKIRETMKETFWLYKEQAWGMDEVRPITGNGTTTRNGWAATIVDTLTTTAMMGLTEEFALEVNWTLGIDWSVAKGLVDPFETTIRYLGALVSTVDLIDASVVPANTIASSQRTGILGKAIDLATKLAPGFDSPTGMVWPRINFTSNLGCREAPANRPYPELDYPTIGPARAGSNWLENWSLSRLTGDSAYEANATRAWKGLVWNRYIEEWPGLVDAPINIFTGEPIERHRSWGAGHDSYYEYLLKAAILHPENKHAPKYLARWVQAVETTIRELRWHSEVPSSPPPSYRQHIYLAHFRNGWLLNEMTHLSCFAGGNILMGGKYTKRQDIVNFGLELIETCRYSYEQTTTGIGPEEFSFTPEGHAPAFEPEGAGQEEQRTKWGHWVTDASWRTRPEYVESLFYAWRITGEERYRTWAWEAYTAFVAAAKAPYGYAEVKDVTISAGKDNIANKAESFWGAETLKYLYLTFTDDAVGSLDEWVYSTEAHPFRISK